MKVGFVLLNLAIFLNFSNPSVETVLEPPAEIEKHRRLIPGILPLLGTTIPLLP